MMCDRCELPTNVELGQILFSSNKIQQYDCPAYVVALLRDIARKLDITMWNITQEEYDNPFDNTGNSFVCDVFEVHAYNWDDETIQPYNFKCGDVEISWYKYCGRDCTMNNQYTIYEMIDMYNRCIKKLEEMNEGAEDEDCD